MPLAAVTRSNHGNRPGFWTTPGLRFRDFAQSALETGLAILLGQRPWSTAPWLRASLPEEWWEHRDPGLLQDIFFDSAIGHDDLFHCVMRSGRARTSSRVPTAPEDGTGAVASSSTVNEITLFYPHQDAPLFLATQHKDRPANSVAGFKSWISRRIDCHGSQ